MQQTMENTGALERRIDLTVPVEAVEKEVQTRLAKLARNVKMPGFRPGKVPMKWSRRPMGRRCRLRY
jgi:trigger factor